MNPRDFLQIATDLSKGSKPAEFRTAISRAYYAAYHVGVEFLEGMGCSINKNDSGHEQLSSNFNNSGDFELSTISTKLQELRSKRNKADYQLDQVKIENTVNSQAAVMQAEKIIKTLDQCTSSTRRSDIAMAIIEYRKKIGH